jgi:hypothetical protein
MRRLFGELFFKSKFPKTFQYWQPKAQTLNQQLPLWGKITDSFTME